MGFSRQGYWSGLPCPPSEDLSNPGIEPMPLALASRFFTTETPGKAHLHDYLEQMRYVLNHRLSPKTFLLYIFMICTKSQALPKDVSTVYFYNHRISSLENWQLINVLQNSSRFSFMMKKRKIYKNFRVFLFLIIFCLLIERKF